MPPFIRDHLLQLPRDVMAAFGLLTRIPVPFVMARPAAAWAWPLVGLVVSGVGAAVGFAALAAGVSGGVAAVVVIAVQVVLTGALHEDGLADCADGFFGGHTPARRLEIMKDSQIGSFGALALMLVVLARWAALAGLMAAGAWGAVIAAGVLARAPMAVLMAVMPNARGTGLSASVGAPPLGAAGVAVAMALGLALVLAGWAGVAMTLVAGLAALAVALVARAKIGGQTGDVLGATAVLAEVCALVVAG